MPKGGDRKGGQYANRQRADGSRYLDNVAELVCYRSVAGDSDELIAKFVLELADEVIDDDRIEAIRSSAVGRRRIEWLTAEQIKLGQEPKSIAEVFAFAKKNLIKLTRARISDRDKIAANKALVELALREKEHGPTEVIQEPLSEALRKLAGLQ